MIPGLLALLGALIMVTQVMAGIWTSNNFLYKPSEGARGALEKARFDSGFNQVDSRLSKERWLGDPGGTPGYDTLAHALTTISTDHVILRIPVGTVAITTDTTIPANITLKLERGAVLAVATTKTLTINGGLEAGLYPIFSCTGTGKVVFGNGSVEKVYSEWWGAKGDGTTDCTAAIGAATNAADGKVPVKFLAGNYLVTNSLALTTDSYSWIGPRSQKGIISTPAYPKTIIIFRPVDTTKFMVSRYEESNPADALGPFEHKNIKFDIGDSNGFEFGRESLGAGVDGTVQRYIHGVRFENCSIWATSVTRGCTDGVLTRSGRKMVWLTKAFEASFDGVSLCGGDTQIRTFGHDRPIFRNIRSQWSHLPFDLNGAGYFGVEAVFESLQVEGWTFTPIRSVGCGVTASNLRLEQYGSGMVAGAGRYNLTSELSITAAVTVGATSLTFSQNMTGILFPGLSIIELSDGTADNTTTCLVSSVSGATVGIYSNDAGNTYIHWADSTANVVRIHGYGPIHQPGTSLGNSSYVNVAAGASLGCPTFVYVPGRAPMNIANAVADVGAETPSPSLVIGNRAGEQYYLNPQMSFTNCSPLVMADPAHPLVHVDNWRQNYGVGGYDGGVRSKSGDLFSNLSQVQRVWAFTPKDSSTSWGDKSKLIPVVKLAGETNTSQFIYAWLLDNATQETQLVTDKSLPTSGNIRIRIKAKAKNATGKLHALFCGNSTNDIATITLSTSTWTTYELITPVPSSWQGSRDGSYLGPGFLLYRDTEDIYVAGVTVEELAPGIGLPVLTAAPANPYQGMMVIANRATWDPSSVGSGGPYVVWYNGTAWARINAQ